MNTADRQAPSIADLARAPELACEVPADRLPDLLADVARVQAVLLARLMSPNGIRSHTAPAPVERETYLTADEAAAMFNVTRRWLYRHGAQMGGHRLSRKVMRFTASGIRRYLARLSR